MEKYFKSNFLTIVSGQLCWKISGLTWALWLIPKYTLLTKFWRTKLILRDAILSCRMETLINNYGHVSAFVNILINYFTLLTLVFARFRSSTHSEWYYFNVISISVHKTYSYRLIYSDTMKWLVTLITAVIKGRILMDIKYITTQISRLFKCFRNIFWNNQTWVWY